MVTVGPLPIEMVTPPDDLATVFGHSESGRLDPSVLVAIGPAGQLHHCAARAYNALAFLCMSIGLPLTYTFGGTYRSFAQQENLFYARTEHGWITGRRHYYYRGEQRSLRQGVAGCATPGSSNHGWGLAVDFAYDIEPRDGIGPDDAAAITAHPKWAEFKTMAVNCGFSWEDPSEPWHLRLVTGSEPTPWVLAVEAMIAGPPEQPSGYVTVEDTMQIFNPPRRAYDSRDHIPFAAGDERVISLGVGAQAAMVNLTVISPDRAGFVSAWGQGGRPSVSAVNFASGQTIANCVPVPVVDGQITVFSMAGCHLCVDVYGVWT